jgi:hypothetical protein
LAIGASKEVREKSMTRNIGGSILPSAGRDTYHAKEGKYGSFETRPMTELDTHGLYFAYGSTEIAKSYVLIASHPNGYSCDELAKRMVSGWATGDTKWAMEQFDYILACGGRGIDRETVEGIANGLFEGALDLDLANEMSRPGP